jgi:hypothetical protein
MRINKLNTLVEFVCKYWIGPILKQRPSETELKEYLNLAFRTNQRLIWKLVVNKDYSITDRYIDPNTSQRSDVVKRIKLQAGERFYVRADKAEPDIIEFQSFDSDFRYFEITPAQYEDAVKLRKFVEII